MGYPKLGVVMVSMRQEMWQGCAEMIRSQSRQPDLFVIVRHRVAAAAEPFRQLPIPLVELAGDADRLVGDLCNYGVDRAVSAGMDWATMMEDDDWYGPGYLAELEQTILDRPDAWAIGKASFWTEWPETGRHMEPFEGSTNGLGQCRSVAGSTITINLACWRQWPVMRFPSAQIADFGFINKLTETWTKLHMEPVPDWPPIITTSMENYRVRRFLNADHRHCWLDPRDRRPSC